MKRRSLPGRLLLLIFKVVVAVFLFTIAQVAVLKWIPVYFTPLMIKRSIEYRDDNSFHTRKKWVPLEKISKNLPKSVVSSEDNLFFTHKGFDWKALEDEIEKTNGKMSRGCSTISQQTAKNVFTTGTRSYFRKGVEMYYTCLIEWIWGKKRIMEVYLNVIEMGRGIYGAEAAARACFSKPASELSLQESALIAACLPNPLKRNAAKPTEYLLQRQSQIIRISKTLDWKPLEDIYRTAEQ